MKPSRSFIAVSGILALACCLGSAGCGGRETDAESGNAAREGIDYKAMIDRTRRRNAEKEHLDRLQQNIVRFQTVHGRSPTNLYELVRGGLIDAIPNPPEGMVFLYDPVTGNIQLAPAEGTDREAFSAELIE